MVKRKAGRFLCSLAMPALVLVMSACGLRDIPEPASDEGDNQSETQKVPEEISAQNRSEEPDDGDNQDQGSPSAPDGKLAVADFFYMPMESDLIDDFYTQYAFDDEYLYFTDVGEVLADGEGPSTTVVRTRILDGYQEETYIVGPKSRWESFSQALLVDGDGNCYLFWGPGGMEDVAVDGYSLEKYGTDGELLWHADYTPEELQDMGEMLRQGTVTEDGRVFLYSCGEDGRIFAFSREGKLEEVYSPKLESLEGLVVGKDGKVYGYCVTGKERLFAEVGDEGLTAVCPVVPLQVYDTHGEGICLRTGDGIWSYEPETGETGKLWGWSDEYIQMDGSHVNGVFGADGGYMLLCREQAKANSTVDMRPVYTFVQVAFADSREYPEKQKIRLATVYRDTWLEQMVKLYNRYSKKYYVEIEGTDTSSLKMELVQGAGPDLVNTAGFYAEDLAEHGVFEELAPYYENSRIVDSGDILEAVRKACTIKGKEVCVMPIFTIDTFLAEEPWCEPEDWTVWKFLEMGKENRLFQTQRPGDALEYCMGIQYGEHFIDWDKKECRFDSDEFCRILEACGEWKSYGGRNDINSQGSGDGDYLLRKGNEIDSVYDLLSDGEPEYFSRLVGYPGWEGGEYKLQSSGMFAINSASEYKEGAWEFLEYLLSEAYQGMLEGAFPVRKECFREYVENPYRPAWMDMFVDSETGEGPARPGENEISLLTDMLDAAVYDSWNGKGNPVWDIVAYEAGMYFEEDCTLEDTVDKIQNRVQTWLNEQ